MSSTVRLVQTPEALEELARVLEREPRIGADTEANSFHAYRERVCLIQLSIPGADYLVDPLEVDPTPLRPLLGDPAREVIFHAAEYDVRSLKRDFGITIGRLFDTQAAAMVLGHSQMGYARLVAERFGVHLAKAQQRSNWGRRPLSDAQITYAAADTRYLLPLRDALADELDRHGRAGEARAVFDRLAGLAPIERPFDPEGFFKLKGYRELDATGRAVLRALFLAREARAERLNVPPFKVLGNEVLIELARRRPHDLEVLLAMRGVPGNARGRFGEALLEAIRAGEADPQPPPGRPRRDRGGPDPEVEERFERLRGWRKTRAEARGVPVQVIATGQVLRAVARANPADLDALSAVDGIDPFVVRTFGPEILAALRLGH